jgi:hypothetical protein
MTGTPFRRQTALAFVLSAILGAIGLVDPVAAEDAAGAPPDPGQALEGAELIPSGSEPAGEIDGLGYDWILCRKAEQNFTTVLVLTARQDCLLHASLGFAFLDQDGTNGYLLEICNYSGGAPLEAFVDPEGPQAPIWYTDPVGGGCYVRRIGYPVRKFLGYWAGIYSDWQSPVGCTSCPVVR